MDQTTNSHSCDELIARLARFLLLEQRNSRREITLLHELTVEERVSKGICLSGMQPLGLRHGTRLAFHFPQQACKLREGDWMVLSKGQPVGPEIGLGVRVIVEAVDPLSRTVTLEPVGNRWEGLPALDGLWTLDYLSSDMNTRRMVQYLTTELPRYPDICTLLQGRGWPDPDQPLDFASQDDLNPSQINAAREALTRGMTLIHGPPGTGKTRLLAAIISILCTEGCTVLVSAFTHRAIDNLLNALIRTTPDLPVLKLGRRTQDLEPRIQTVLPNRLRDIRPGTVTGSTIYGLMRLHDGVRYDCVFIDEASQLPTAHAVIPLMRASGNLILAGDHRQLPPVLKTTSDDSLSGSSIFQHLMENYPNRSMMLATSYRLPPTLCDFPNRNFYGDRLASIHKKDPDIPPPSGNLSYPDLEAFWRIPGPLRAAWVDHAGYGSFSPPEAELIARITSGAVRDMQIIPNEIAVVAPHRAQVREITDRVWHHLGASDAGPLIIDTVERMQGQERDVIVLSLCASDQDFILDEAEFILSPNRLNVSMTRARKLLIIVGSRFFFRIYPSRPDTIADAALFRRLEARLEGCGIDLTDQAYKWIGLPRPPPPPLPTVEMRRRLLAD